MPSDSTVAVYDYSMRLQLLGALSHQNTIHEIRSSMPRARFRRARDIRNERPNGDSPTHIPVHLLVESPSTPEPDRDEEKVHPYHSIALPWSYNHELRNSREPGRSITGFC